MREIVVFSGSSHPELAAEICGHLGVALSPAITKRFTNDCLEVQLQANCRERDVFLIQTLSKPVQEHLVELLLMIDAARGASAARITVVMPFYAYARSDKKDAPRISIGGRLAADLLATAGAGRVLTMALHAPQVDVEPIITWIAVRANAELVLVKMYPTHSFEPRPYILKLGGTPKKGFLSENETPEIELRRRTTIRFAISLGGDFFVCRFE